MSPGLVNDVMQAYLPHHATVPADAPPMLGPGSADKRMALAGAPAGDIATVPIVALLLAQHPAATGTVAAIDQATNAPSWPYYRFFAHHHPWACTFLERLDRYSVDGSTPGTTTPRSSR